jgi:hypothetical protein
VDAQAQQIAWHKADMPVWGALFAGGLVAAAVFLVQAAMSPKIANPWLVLLCSVYTSVGTVTAIRQASRGTLALPDRADPHMDYSRLRTSVYR